MNENLCMFRGYAHHWLELEMCAIVSKAMKNQLFFYWGRNSLTAFMKFCTDRSATSQSGIYWRLTHDFCIRIFKGSAPSLRYKSLSANKISLRNSITQNRKPSYSEVQHNCILRFALEAFNYFSNFNTVDVSGKIGPEAIYCRR